MPYLHVSSPVPVDDTALTGAVEVFARALGLPPDAVVAQWSTTGAATVQSVFAEVRGRDRGQPLTRRALAALAGNLAELTGCHPEHVLVNWPATPPGRTATAADEPPPIPEEHSMRPLPDMTPVDDPRAAAAECERRALEREGIPVVLALLDERPDPVRCVDEAAIAEGNRFAALFDTYRAALAPDADEHDAAALYSVVALLGQCHVREGDHA
jgi:hypothetical protein